MEYLWTSIPRLSFSSLDFRTIGKLSDFVTHVLSRCNNQVQLSSFKLYYCGAFGQDVTLRIMNHAFSLNVQQFNITCRFTYHSLFEANAGFTHSLSGSQTLKHLTLSWNSGVDYMMLTSTHEFSSLTTLRLYDITLYDGFLSMCPNLENLTLHCCKMNGSEVVLSICHRRLSNLTLENENSRAFTINVVTPQLKNLTISKYFGGYQISAPELSSLIIKGHCPYTFSTDGFPFFGKCGALFTQSTVAKKLRCFYYYSSASRVPQCQTSFTERGSQSASEFIRELISRQPFLLANLTSLKIMVRHKHTNVYMPFEAITNYLLNGSPKATLTKVLRCERVM